MPSRHVKEEDEESGPEYEQPQTPQPHQEIVQENVFEDENGDPILFFIHKSIKRRWVVENLTQDIETHGGIVRPTDLGVETVLVDERYVNREGLQLSYDASPDETRRETWVEPMTFVQRCIRQGVLVHRLRQVKGMGGSVQPFRVSFTPEDDEHLARYLALRIPDPQAGGRRGEGVYEELKQAADADPERYVWVGRHTWQSWRNRYNKDIQRFNRMIDYYVEVEKPTAKQRYRLDRRTRRGKLREIDRDDFSQEGEEDEGHPSPPPAKRRRVHRSPEPIVEHVEDNSHRSSKGKGKERAQDSSQESDDERSDYRSLFGDSQPDEPGPSVKQRAQPIPNSRGHHARPSPKSSPMEPQTSQATLVASATQLRGRSFVPKQRMPNSSPHQLERRTPSPSPEPIPIVHYDPRDNVPPLSPAEGIATASRQQRSQAIKRARRPRPQSPAPAAPPPEAPYRNTRSRSRSVEPSILPSRTRARPQKKAVNVGEEHLGLAPLEEGPDENDVQTLDSQEQGPTSAPVGETLEEEMDVEELLVTNISGRSHVTEDSVQEPSFEAASSPAEVVEETIDSDDAQMDQMLRQPPPEAVSQNPTSIFLVHPNDMLRQFRDSLPALSTTRPSRLSSVRPVAFPRLKNDTLTRSRYSTNRDPFETTLAFTPTPQSRTPANPRFQRSESIASSVESFPLDGTKASAVKKRIEEEEKHTSYKPPQGTRAALFRQ